MVKTIDMTGEIFGGLTVLERADSDVNGKAMWRCRCECGGVTTVRGDNLRKGHVLSCGCAKRGRPMDVDRPGIIAQYNVLIYSGTEAWANRATHVYCFAHVTDMEDRTVLVTSVNFRMRAVPSLHPAFNKSMVMLVEAGHIEPRGTRTFNRWTSDHGVVASVQQLGSNREVSEMYTALTGLEPE